MNNFFKGIGYFLSGFELIFKPGIKRFVFIPVFINIIIFASFFFIAEHYVLQLSNWFISYLPAWLFWLAYFLWLVFFFSFFLILIYTFVTVSNLLAAPFNSILSEKIEFYLSQKKFEQRSVMENIKDVPRILARQWSLILYYLPRALVLFILFFVPIIQAFAAFFWFLFNAWFMSLTYLDYPTDNNRIPLSIVHGELKRHRSLYLGFGISVLMTSMVPILNFLVMPAAVAGATKLWHERSSF